VSGVRRIGRLLFYGRRYALQAIASVVLLAAVGLLDAFRVVLIGPIFNTVLNPKSPERDLSLFSGRFHFSLQQLVPSHFHNPWSVVAYALIVSTVLKGICDYAGT
jgi:subfamily B ATP-binding cassette protein MsbA